MFDRSVLGDSYGSFHFWHSIVEILSESTNIVFVKLDSSQNL